MRIKNLLYPNLWKIGLAYQKTEIENEDYQALLNERAEMGIEIVPYVSSFGAYAIEYGDTTHIFQNINVFENDKSLKLLHDISLTNGIPSTVEEAALNWLSRVFELWIKSEPLFIRFLPNDALFEIVYNFLDKNAFETSRGQNTEMVIGNTISTVEAKKTITEKYPLDHYSDSDIVLLFNSIYELERRKIDTINRVWIFESTPVNHIRNIYYENVTSIIENNKKLLENLPNYYNEFLLNLFGENDYKNYAYTGTFKIKLEIEFNGHFFKNEYRSIIKDSDKFLVEVVEELLDDTCNLRSCGLLNTSFKGDTHNILANILSMLYKQVCKRFNFENNYSFRHKAFF